MQINLLALDAGNSRLKIAVFEAGSLAHTRHVAIDEPSAWQEAISAAWQRIEGRENAEVAGCASNPAVTNAVGNALTAATRQRVQWIGIGRDIELPCAIRTDQPGQTGVDRVLNIAAAWAQLGKACCVVDAGSAVTVDFCDDTGAFLGGVIAPGAAAQFRAVHQAAPHLPEGKLRATGAPFGTSTADAINAGVFHGIRGLVRAVVEQHALTLDAWPEVIATGGDAQALFGDDPEGDLIHAISPDLIFYGIAHAYAEHHIRHES